MGESVVLGDGWREISCEPSTVRREKYWNRKDTDMQQLKEYHLLTPLACGL